MEEFIGLVSATLGLAGAVVSLMKRREEAKLLNQARLGEDSNIPPQSSSAPAVCVVHQSGQVSPLHVGINTLGASMTNNIVLHNPTVSGSHATLNHKQNGDVILSDVGSTNGSCVNGHRITQPQKLQDGDILAFGSWKCIFYQSPSRSI
jgi:hypothetical protein